MAVDDETLKEILVESHEGLDHLAQDLIELERKPTGSEMLARIFRYIHAIKGKFGLLGLGKLETLSADDRHPQPGGHLFQHLHGSTGYSWSQAGLDRLARRRSH